MNVSILVGMSIDVDILQVLFRQPYFFEISWVQFSCHVWKKLSPIRPLGPLSLTVFLAPLLPCVLKHGWKDCVIGVSIVASHPKVGCSVHFDQLWLSVRVFLWQTEVFSMSCENYVYLWVEG